MKKKPYLFQNKRVKLFRSESYNYDFDLRSGHTKRWGKSIDDDPDWSPFGPEILDIETSVNGCPQRCAFCYKENETKSPTNMSLKTFKDIINKFPFVTTKEGKKIFFLQQVAAGVTSINANPELLDIFSFCRENSIIPNVTINGADNLSDETIRKLVDVCGAIAVSINKTNANSGYELIKKMIDYNASQINIHYVISNQSIEFAYQVLSDIKNDARLKGLNAIVFLGLKPMGRGKVFDILPVSKFNDLVKYCFDNKINFGFDSCSCGRFIGAVKTTDTLDEKKKTELYQLAEPCESGCFSAYVDVSGKYWHCSFGEDKEMAAGIDLIKADNFLKDVWLTEKVENWRRALLKLKRECPLYPEIHSTAK